MKWADIIVLILIAICVIISIIYIRRKKSCCGNCSQCKNINKCK